MQLIPSDERLGRRRTFEARMTNSRDAEQSEVSIDFVFEGDDDVFTKPISSSTVGLQFGGDGKSGKLKRIGRKSRSLLSLSIEKEIDLERELYPEVGKLKRSPRLSRSQFDLSREIWMDLDLQSLRKSKRLSTSQLDVRKEKQVDLDLLSRSQRLSLSQMEIRKEKEVDLDSLRLYQRSKKLSTSQLDIPKEMQVDLKKLSVPQTIEMNNNSLMPNQNLRQGFGGSSNDLEFDIDQFDSGTVTEDPSKSGESSLGRTVSTEYINLIHIDNINHIDPKTGLPFSRKQKSGRGRGKERFAPVNFSFDLTRMLARDHRSRTRSFERTRSLSSRRHSTAWMEVAYLRSRSHDVGVSNINMKRRRTVSAEFVNRIDLGEMGRRKETKYDPVTFNFDISGLLSESLRKSADNLVKSRSRRHTTSMIEISNDTSHKEVSRHNLSRNTKSTEFINSLYLGEVGNRKATRFHPVAFKFDLSGLESPSDHRRNLYRSDRTRSLSSGRRPASVSGTPSRSFSMDSRSVSSDFVNSVDLGEIGIRTLNKYDPVTFKFDLKRMLRSQSASPERKKPQFAASRQMNRRNIYGSVDQIPDSVKKDYNRAVDKYHTKLGTEKDKAESTKSQPYKDVIVQSESLNEENSTAENESIDSQNIAPFNHLRHFWETGKWEPLDLDVSMADDPGDLFPLQEMNPEQEFHQRTGGLFFIERKTKRVRHRSEPGGYRGVKVRKMSRSKPDNSPDIEPRKISLDHREGPTFIEIQSSKLMEITTDGGIQCEDTMQLSQHSNTLEVRVHGRTAEEGIQCDEFGDSIGQISNLSVSLLDLTPTEGSMIANKSFDMSVDAGIQCDISDKSFAELLANDASGLSFMEIQSSKAGFDTTEVGIQISGPEHTYTVDRAVQHEGFDHLVQGYIENDSLNHTFGTGHKLSPTEDSYKDSPAKSRSMSVTSGTQYEISTPDQDIQDRLNMAFIHIESGAQQRQTISQGVQAGQEDLEESHSSFIKIVPSVRKNSSQIEKPFSSSLKVVQDISDSVHSSGLKIVPLNPTHSDYMDTKMHSSALKIVPSQPSEPVRLSTVSQGTQFDDWESVRELDISHDSGNFMFLEISSAGQTSSLSNLSSVRYTQSLDEGLNRLDPSESSFISENEAFELQFFRPIIEDKTESVAVITEGTQWDPDDFGGDSMDDHLYSRSLEFLQIQSNIHDQEFELSEEFDHVSIHDISGEFIGPEAESSMMEGPVGATTNEMSTQSDMQDFRSLVTSGTQYDLEEEIFSSKSVDSITQTETREKQNNKEKILVSQGIQAYAHYSVISETGRKTTVHEDSLPKQTDRLSQIQSPVPKERQIESAGKIVKTPDVMNTQTKTIADGDRQQNIHESTEKIPEHESPKPGTEIAITSKQVYNDKVKTSDESISLAISTSEQLHKQSPFENLPSTENITDFVRRDSGPYESLHRERKESETVIETFQELQFRKPEDLDLLIDTNVDSEHYVQSVERTVSHSNKQKTDQNVTSEFSLVPATQIVVVEADGEPEEVEHELVHLSDHPDIWQGFAHEKVLVLKEEAENYELKPDSNEAIKTVISDSHRRTMGNIRQRKTVCLTPVQVRMREIPDVEHLSDEDLDGVEANVSGVKKKVSRHVKFTGKWGNKYKEIERNRKHRDDYNHDDDDDDFDYDSEMESYELVDEVETGQIYERLHLNIDRQDSEEGYEPLRRWPPLGSDNRESGGDNENENQLEIRQDSDSDGVSDQWNQIEESQQHVDSSEFSEPSEIEHDDTEERFRDVSTDEDKKGIEIADVSGDTSMITRFSPDQWDLVDETRHKDTDTDNYGLKRLMSGRGEVKKISKDSKDLKESKLGEWSVEDESISQDSKNQFFEKVQELSVEGFKSDETKMVEVSDILASQLYLDNDQVVISHHKVISDSETMFDPWEWEVVKENLKQDETNDKDTLQSSDMVDQMTSGDSDTTETGSTMRDQWVHQGDDLGNDVGSQSSESRSPDWVQIEKHVPHDSGEESSEHDNFRESDDESFQEISFAVTPNQSQEIGPTQEDILYEENKSIGESFESYDTAEEDSFQFDRDEKREYKAGSDIVPQIKKEEVDKLSIKSDDEESTRVFRIVEKESKGDILDVNVLDDSEISSDALDEEKCVVKGETLKCDKHDSDEETFEVPEVKMTTGEYDDNISENIKNFDTVKGAKSKKTSVKNTTIVENVKERKLKQGKSVVKQTSSKYDTKTKSVENVKEKRTSGGKRIMKRIARDDFSDDYSEEYYYDSSSEFDSEDSEGFCRTPVSKLTVEGTESLEERPVGETASSGREKDRFEKKEAIVDRVEVIAPESVARIISEMLDEESQEVNVAPSRLVDDVTSDSSELDISFPESRSPEVVSPEPEAEQAERLKKPDAYEFIDVSDDDTRNLVKPSEVDVSSVEAFGDTNLMKEEVSKQSTKHTEQSEHSDSTVEEWKMLKEPESTVDQSHRTLDEPHDPKDPSVDTGKVKATSLSSKPSAVSSKSKLVTDKLKNSEVTKPELETKKRIKKSAQSVSMVEKPDTDFRQIKLKSISKPNETKAEIDTNQSQQIQDDDSVNVDAEITKAKVFRDGEVEKRQIRVSEQQGEHVEEVSKETKHKINREEEHEFQRIKLKTNVKRCPSDHIDPGYSSPPREPHDPEYNITPHVPQVGADHRMTELGKIQGESTLTSEVSSGNNFADILNAEDINVNNQSSVSSSLSQSTKSSSSTTRELSLVKVPYTEQVKLKKTDLIKREIPQEEVEFPDLRTTKFTRDDANENVEKLSLKKVTKSETEEGEIKNKTAEQASSAEILPSGEFNSTGKESKNEEIEEIRKVTDKIAEEKREQHSTLIQQKVEDLQNGRASLRQTIPDRNETSKVESDREPRDTLEIEVGVPRKTEDIISESSSSRASTRTSPLKESFRLKSVTSSSPRRKDLSPEPEPVPYIEQVKLRKTGLIKTKAKKEELEETNLQTTPLPGTKKDENTESIDSTRVSNTRTHTDSKVKEHPYKDQELTNTEQLRRTNSSTVNDANKYPSEKSKASTVKTAEEMHDKFPIPQKETDKKAKDLVCGRTSLRKTGLDPETLKPKSQLDRDDKPKAEDKNETKSRSGNIRESARTEESELRSTSPLPLTSPQPAFMEEVKLRKTGLIKRKIEDEELIVVGSLEGITSKNEDETKNLRTVSEKETCEDQEEVADESKELSVENEHGMKEEIEVKEEQRIKQGQAALRKTGLNVGKSQEAKNDRPETDISKVKQEGALKSSGGERSPSTGPFQLKPVTSSLSRTNEAEPSAHIEQVKLRKTDLIKRGDQEEEWETAQLQDIGENLNDESSDQFHHQKILQQESDVHAPEKETLEKDDSRSSPSRTAQNLEKGQPLTFSTKPLAEKHKENVRPAEPEENKPTAKQFSPKQDATELELLTLKPVSRSQPTEDTVTLTESSRAEDKEIASFEKEKVQNYSSGTQRLRKEAKESDTTKTSPTESGEETETSDNGSTSSSPRYRQTSPSPEPMRLKSLTARSVRTRERSPEPVPHIQQVKLKKTSIVKREIPKEELENVDLQETMFGAKDNEESDGMVTLKKVPETENASLKADKESVEYSGTEIKFDDLPDRSKLSSSDFERQPLSPVMQEKTGEIEYGKDTEEETSQDPDKDVAKGKYQRGDKKKEDEREDKTKIILGKGKLPAEHNAIETVFLKPVPVSKSVRPTKKGKQQPEQEDEKPMFGLKPRTRPARTGDKNEKKDAEGNGTVDRETLSKTEEIFDITEDEDNYNRQSLEKGKKGNKDDEGNRKSDLGKGSLKFNAETEETVTLKPIPTTQTFETDNEDQKEYDNAEHLNISGSKSKSQKSTKSDEFTLTIEAAENAFSDEESRKGKVLQGKGSLEGDKSDFENVTSRPVPELTVLQDGDDQHSQETSVKLSTSTPKLHSKALTAKVKI